MICGISGQDGAYLADEVIKLMTRRNMRVVDAVILAVAYPEFLKMGVAGIHAFGKPAHALYDVSLRGAG